MLNCPFLPPFRDSSLLAGGILKSARDIELLIILNFILAFLWISGGSFVDTSPIQIFSVSFE